MAQNPPYPTADQQIENAAFFMQQVGMSPDQISHNDPTPDPGVLMAQIQATENQLRIHAQTFARQAGIWNRLKTVIFGTSVTGLDVRSLDGGSGQFNGPEQNQ